MNMSFTNMNSSPTDMTRTQPGGVIIKNKEFSMSRLPRTTRNSTANPMRMFVARKPQGPLIDEALDILNSPVRTVTSSKASVPGRISPCVVGARRRSTLSERRASELLLDNSDFLSSLMLSGTDVDMDSDNESDLDV